MKGKHTIVRPTRLILIHSKMTSTAHTPHFLHFELKTLHDPEKYGRYFMWILSMIFGRHCLNEHFQKLIKNVLNRKKVQNC